MGQTEVSTWGLLVALIIAGIWMSVLQRRIERLERTVNGLMKATREIVSVIGEKV